MNPVMFSPAFATRSSFRPGLAGVRMGSNVADEASRYLNDVMTHLEASKGIVHLQTRFVNTEQNYIADFSCGGYTLSFECVKQDNFPYEIQISPPGRSDLQIMVQFGANGEQVNILFPNDLDYEMGVLLQHRETRQRFFKAMRTFLQTQGAKIVTALPATI